VKAIILELRIHEWWENPDIGTRGPKNLLENCHDGGVVLAIPARLQTELGRQDQDGVVLTIISASPLLDPRAHLLQEESSINDELVSSKKGEVGNGVRQGSKYNHLTMLVLTRK
jgi:hypothetical protein